jgi:hypothetical protein
MITLLKNTIEAIDNFNITATVETLKAQYPNMSEAQINEIVAQQLTYLGSGKRSGYSILLTQYENDKRRKEDNKSRTMELLIILIIQMFKDAIGEPKRSLVDTYNKYLSNDDMPPTSQRRFE